MGMSKRYPRWLAIALLVVPLACQAADKAKDDSLFRAFGGEPGLNTLMADFVPRLIADAQIGRYFKSTNREHLARQLAAQVCQLAGGPCTYDGPAMGPAHEGMGITRADFNQLDLLGKAHLSLPPAQMTRAAHLLPLGRQQRSSRPLPYLWRVH